MFKTILFLLLTITNSYQLNIWKRVNFPSKDPLKYNYFDFTKSKKGEWMEANRTDIEKDLDLEDSY
tara:strand:- start:538 stop:735 length:198 start_codon:yes stop_codon:yes gene_type:complete